MTAMNSEVYTVEKFIFDHVDTLEDDSLEKLKNAIANLEHERREHRLIGKIFSHNSCTGVIYYVCTYVVREGGLSGIFLKANCDGTVNIGNQYGFPIEAKELKGPLPSNVIDAFDIVHSLAGRYDNLRKMEPEKDK